MRKTSSKIVVNLLVTLLFASFFTALPVLANPDFSLSVSNVVLGQVPSSDWNYVIKDNSTNNVVVNFTLHAYGGQIVFPSLDPVGQLYTITQGGVTHFVTPIHGDLPPWSFYAYNATRSSGNTPYMEYAKSKIYLYEYNGGLTLFIHHNVFFGLMNYVMNMSITGLPAEANSTYSDDPGDFNYVGGGTSLGFWNDGNTSDGGIVPNLHFSGWNITAQVHWASGISAWEYQTSGGAITLNMSQPLIIRKFTGSLGGDYLIAETPKYGYTTSIDVNGTVTDDVSETLVHIGANDAASVTFINTFVVYTTLGITIDNVVEGTPPSSPWNYTITDLFFNNIVANFALPAEGGSKFFSVGEPGGVYLINQTSKHYYSTTIALSAGANGSIIDDSALVSIGGPSVNVTFTNSLYGGFTIGSVGELPSVDLGYSIPTNKPIPVQATWNTDINNDGKIDLVLGKP
ncbi:hypothetical protein MUP77_10155, partial [Candidatus Bathyarchaeota archaeon]|nr:hypothetical protein [Candidatus Bathyarchaeota archaeon]